MSATVRYLDLPIIHMLNVCRESEQTTTDVEPAQPIETAAHTLASTSSDLMAGEQTTQELVEDDNYEWIDQYNAEMEAASKIFPISEEDMDALHIKYYDPAYERMMLSFSAPSAENSPKRSVQDRIRSKKARAALAAAKVKFIKMNEDVGAAAYLALLGGPGNNPLSEEDAVKFVEILLKKTNRDLDYTQEVKLVAMALSTRINTLSVVGEGANSERLAVAKQEAIVALEAQIGANRLLGSRVEELERENSELHRILDDNTNKALDSWSSGQLKISKLEEEIKKLKEEKIVSEKAVAQAQAKANAAEHKLEQLRTQMEAFVAEEEKTGVRFITVCNLCLVPALFLLCFLKQDGGFIETAFACIPGIAGFATVKE